MFDSEQPQIIGGLPSLTNTLLIFSGFSFGLWILRVSNCSPNKIAGSGKTVQL